MKDGKVFVVMTASGKVKEYMGIDTIREVLESVYNEHMTAGSNWDRPDRLFIDGKCVVEKDVTGVAWDYGKFWREQEDELEAALDGWVQARFSRKGAA